MLKDEMIEVLRRILERDEDILIAYLFGSAATGVAQPISDVDVAVLLKDSSLKKQSNILWEISKSLHIPEDKTDLVDLGRADLHFKYRVLKQGIKLVDKGFEEGLIHELIEKYPEARESFNAVLSTWLKEDPQIDRILVSKRLDEILRNADVIRRFALEPLDRILADLERTLAFERGLERTIGAMADICRHIVSTKGLGLIETLSEYPIRLAQHRFMPEKLAGEIAELIKLRNILAHRYLEIDYKKMHTKAREISEHIVPRYTEWVKKMLEES